MLSFKQFIVEAVLPEREPEPLHNHYLKHDNPEITPGHILRNFHPDIKDEIKDKIAQASKLPTTTNLYSRKDKSGNNLYTKDRQAIHKKIFDHFLSDENIKRSTPEKGTKPKFVVLGGRGGSGKSAFTNGTINEFDHKKFLTIDSDKVKEMLPEYRGWNAAQLHEESTDITNHITNMARKMKLNHIHDATLKTNKVEDDIIKSKKNGYSVEGHYMHVPREVSATRAVQRYLGKGKDQRKRLVPIDIVLGNTDNERNFDGLKKHFDKWSAYDNNVPKGEPPKLISKWSKK